MLYLTPKNWVNCLTYYGRKPQQRRFPFIGENLLIFWGFYYTFAPLTPKKWVNCLIYYGRKPQQRRIPFIGENLLTFGIFLLYLSSFCSQKRTYSSHKLGKFFLCLIPYLKQICKGNEAHFMGARLINRERGEFFHISVGKKIPIIYGNICISLTFPIAFTSYLPCPVNVVKERPLGFLGLPRL